MRRLRRLFNRSQLDQNELNILRGILSALAPGSGARPSRPLPGPLRSVEATPPAIYLDYAASTPLLEEVRETMLECLGADGPHANPSPTSHGPAKAAWAIVERAQADVAALLGAGPEEIVFTSGATEANNLAIIGAARQRSHRGRHLVTALTEHAAVLEPFRHLERNGFTVTWLSPDAQGRIDPATLEAALRPDTTLVSLMHVNNETGVINDLGSLGALCRDRDIWFHCDAAQGLDHLALDLGRVPIDLLSLSAHKFYGPKGVGALYLRRERIRRVEPLLFGGGQQRSLRPGSLPAHQLAGLGAAARLAAVSREPRARHLEALRDRLWAQLRGLPDTWLNGEGAPRAGHILNVSVAGVHGESLHRALQPLAVSAGSSCAAGRGEPSHVLRCLGRSQALAESSVRFSFGLPTGDEEVDRAALLFRETVTRLRRLAGPLAV
ncbi:MAG: aminotransferase class V-fold PLP-dependent enzyme [Chromatiales bacterium]|nr:aminotransferase class V-fold PLP-dependent enzyme [Chromatiales bacterium]